MCPVKGHSYLHWKKQIKNPDSVEDAMLIIGRDPKKIGSLKKALSKSFTIKDMGPAKQILGIHIIRNRTKKLL